MSKEKFKHPKSGDGPTKKRLEMKTVLQTQEEEKRQREAEIEKIIEAKVSQALRRLQL